MDPATIITAGVSGVTSLVQIIQKAKQGSKDKKVENTQKKIEARQLEIKAHEGSDRQLLKMVEEGKCEGIGDVKKFKKLMKEVFERHPEEQAVLGLKLKKCCEIAKKGKNEAKKEAKAEKKTK